MFTCSFCSSNATHFCDNSRLLVCDKDISTYIKKGYKGNLLSFDFPLKKEYSEAVSKKLELYISQINELIRTILGSLSVFYANINKIEKNAIKTLITLQNTYSNQIKKLYEKTLTMNEAKDIYDTELKIDSQNLDSELKRLGKHFSELFYDPSKNKKVVTIDQSFKLWNCECGASNTHEFDACHLCQKIKPGLNNIMKNEDKASSTSQTIAQRKKCNSNKRRTIIKGQDISINTTNTLIKNKHEKSFLSYKKLEIPDFSIELSDKLPEVMFCSNCHFKYSENEKYCLHCKFPLGLLLQNTSKTEKINEPIQEGKHERLRSNSSNIYLDEEHEEFKKSYYEKSSTWRCYLCFQINDEKYKFCSNCHKDKDDFSSHKIDTRKSWIYSCRYENILDKCINYGENKLDNEKFDEKEDADNEVKKCSNCLNVFSVTKCSNCNKETKISTLCSYCSKPLGDITICYFCENKDVRRKLSRSKSQHKKIGFLNFNTRCKGLNK